MATSIKDATIQDKDMRIIGGGTVNFQAVSTSSAGTLTFEMSNPAFLSIPGLANNINQLPNSIVFTAPSSGDADQIASIVVRRTPSSTAVQTVTISDTASYVPSRDKIVIARRLGLACYVGVNGSMRYLAGESAPLDGNLSLFGFIQGQIPLQLRLAPDAAVPAGVGASVADAETMFNIDSGGGQQLFNLSITGEDGSARILRFPGAVLDFSLGKIYNPGTTTNWLGRADNAEGTAFSMATIGTNQEVWYAISLEFDSVIMAADTPNAIRTTDIGKALARIVVSNGEPAAIGTAVSAPFSGSIPIGQIRLFNTGTTLQPVDGMNIIQLGASGGGGGGGSGDASQTINDFINRLNLSTFNYFTPIVGSVFSTREQIDESNSSADLVIGNNGIQVTAGQRLQSLQLIDPEYLAENVDGIQTVEIDAEWGVDNDGTQRIDPNAIWEIRKQSSDSFAPCTSAVAAIISGYIDNTNTLRGVNLSGFTPNATNANIFFAENHGLYTGQRVTFTLGNITIQDPSNTGSNGDGNTSYYVHRIDNSAFSLYGSRVLADAAGTRVTITSIVAPVGAIANLPAGVLPRIGITNVVRASLEFTTTVSPASNLDIRVRVTGDANATIRTQANDGLLLGFGLFYDQDGADVESIPRTLDNVAEILRSNHLSNTETTTAGYGVAGRGIVLKNNASTPVDTEIALDANNNITIAGTAPITTNGATPDQILSYNGTSFVPVDTAPASQQLNLIQALGMRRTTPEAPSGTPSTASVQSFTWQVPDGVDNIFVIMAGAGSSGGGGVSNGGAAGAFFQDWLRVVPGQTYNIQVGDGSVRADGGNTSHEVGGSTFIEGTTTALIDGQTSVRIQASGAPFSSASGGTTGNVSFSAGTNTYTVPANLNNIDGGVNTTRFFSSNVLGGFLPAFGKLQDSDWNDVMFRTTGSGTAGGDTAIAARVNPADQSGTGQGGGGAGFLQGETPAGVQGFGRASGPGGIRIGWYSNSEFAPAHPLVTV